MNKLFFVAIFFLIPSAWASEVTLLGCDFQYTNSTQAPFWKTMRAEFVQPDRQSLPLMLDQKPTNLGGENPSWDTMVFCSTISVQDGNGGPIVSVSTKRTQNMVDQVCSQLDPSLVLSAQTETFGAGGLSQIDYRFYDSSGASSQRRKVTYFGDPTEFSSFDQVIAEAKCDDIAGQMGGF